MNKPYCLCPKGGLYENTTGSCMARKQAVINDLIPDDNNRNYSDAT